MLQGCNKGVTMVLLCFYKGVVWVFHLCFNEVKRVLQECYLGVTKVFLGCHKVVTPKCFNGVTCQELRFKSDKQE